MTFKYTFRVEDEGTTVPYPAVKDEIRDNRGFVDLRGRPDRADEIAESMASPALRNLLRELASTHSPIFTLGCDLGFHLEPTSVPASRRAVAGGYVQIAGIYYDRSRLMVVSLLPKACKKANGNSPASNGCSTSAEIACSISTAFTSLLF